MGQALKFCRDCDNKRGCHSCKKLHAWVVHSFCTGVKPMTNGDRIRAMSDDAMADLLTVEIDWILPCKLYIALPTGDVLNSKDEAKGIVTDWLQQPVDEEDYHEN